MITAAMRDLLVSHIDGPIRVRLKGCNRNVWEAALKRKYICGTVNGQARPRYSRLTQHGREVLAKELAQWAESLVRAGYDMKVTPKWSHPQRLAA